MLKTIVAVGVCIFALMVVVKDGRVLRDAGLTGSCSVARRSRTRPSSRPAARASSRAGPTCRTAAARSVGVTGNVRVLALPGRPRSQRRGPLAKPNPRRRA